MLQSYPPGSCVLRPAERGRAGTSTLQVKVHCRVLHRAPEEGTKTPPGKQAQNVKKQMTTVSCTEKHIQRQAVLTFTPEHRSFLRLDLSHSSFYFTPFSSEISKCCLSFYNNDKAQTVVLNYSSPFNYFLLLDYNYDSDYDA